MTQGARDDPSNPLVLLVDDNRDAVDMVSEYLRMHGIESRVAYDGYAALSTLAQWPADIVFVDIQMPGMDGFQTAAAMHALPGCADLPIVAWSGWDGGGGGDSGAAARLAARLTKPVAVDVVLDLIRDWHARSGARRA